MGSLACQLAKNVFGAAKVITTVSTEKVGKIDKLLGNGVVDQSLLALRESSGKSTDGYG